MSSDNDSPHDPERILVGAIEPEDDDDDDTYDEDEETTEDEEDEEHLAPADSSVVPVVDHVPSAGDTEAFETDESAPTPRSPQTRVPFSQTQLSEVTGASEHRMMTSIEEVNLRVSYPGTRFRMRGQRTTYETELHERQRAEDDAVRQIMRTQVAERQDYRMITAGGTPVVVVSFIISICIDIVIISHVHCVLVIIRIMPITRQGTNDAMTPESIQSVIDWAIQRNSTQDDDSQNSGGGIRRPVQPARVCTYPDFVKCQPLNFKGTEGVVGLNQWLEKMESVFHISCCAIENQVKFATCTLLGAALTWWNGHVRTLGYDAAYAMTWGTFKKKLSDKYCPNELALMCTKFLADETAKIDKYIGGLPDNIYGNVMSARPKTLDFANELANDLMDQKLRTYAERQNENKRKADDSRSILGTYLFAPSAITTILDNVHPSVENARAQGRAYALGGRDASPDSNVITGTFLLNNRYATVLFDTGADRSFVSNTFSTMIDITPTTLENHYDVELADGKIIGVNTIIQGCTLNFMNHPFNIDLMLVLLGSFDAIIGMDWLTKHHGVIIYDEKIVRVPFEREMLIFQGNGNNQKKESRLNIISCTKAQEYLSKGCDVFLAYITTKEAEDKSEEKRLEDVPIVRDFPEVFPKDLPGIPPTRQVEFQIDLVPGAAPIARAPYRLAPSEIVGI
ncbi:putative reverse transcriptase domain-containing protein [Tanacetum coccineum]